MLVTLAPGKFAAYHLNCDNDIRAKRLLIMVYLLADLGVINHSTALINNLRCWSGEIIVPTTISLQSPSLLCLTLPPL